ncbi:hypothetical protein Vadar_015917 [Vaccinium darrowii]|uniref:Uncharacterized protein n=1 Tax=Vaccinium darrowii TaxID=229202 RepID=A0ACB7Z477_9ERIC|nr:hypothetical protein Vadar_015917 [Vaccinium darrowii]
MDSDIGKSLDSINKLPNSILCHRLSFLSTKNAVGSSILSTRWQHLWNFVTSLNFNDYVLFPDRYEFDGRCEMVDLSFMNFVKMEFSLVNLSSLLKAKLRTWLSHSWHPTTNYGPSASKLLRGIANVEFLDILIEVEGHVLPTFPNLTHLRLGLDCISCWNRDLLGGFLRCSPYLEVLILEGESPGSGELWGPPPQVPSCLTLHLKEVEILQFDGKEYQLELIKYILKNAKVLKKMTIGYLNSSSCFCNLSKKRKKSSSCVCMALSAFARGSRTCELNLRL